MELSETQWLDSVGDRDNLPSAIVAGADLTRPDIDEILATQSTSRRLRGIRHIVGRDRPPDGDDDVVDALLAHQLHDPRHERHVRS